MPLNCGSGEDSWESLGQKGDQTSEFKGNQPWIFIGKTDAEAEAPTLWPPDAKSWLRGKDPDAGKDWRQDKKGTTEDEMFGWHHWLNEWTWVWAYSGTWWRIAKPGVLQSMDSHWFEHEWATEAWMTEQLNDCILDSFVDYEVYAISSKGFLPTVVDIMVGRWAPPRSVHVQYANEEEWREITIIKLH